MTFWTAGAIVLSGAMGSNAARSAANTQADAAANAADLQYKQYQQTRQDQMPWMQAGQRALKKLEGASDYTPFSYNQ